MSSVGENYPRRVAPARAGDAAAGVRAGAAEIQAAQGRAILRPAGNGAQEEELVEAHVAVKDVAARQGEFIL